MGIHGILVIALRLIQRELGLFRAVGGVGAVDGVEHRSLFNGVPHRKIGGEHGAGHQRIDGVGVGGGNGAGAAEHIGDIPALHRAFQIFGIYACRFCAIPGQQERTGHCGCAGGSGNALPVAPYKRSPALRSLFCRHFQRQIEFLVALFLRRLFLFSQHWLPLPDVMAGCKAAPALLPTV